MNPHHDPASPQGMSVWTALRECRDALLAATGAFEALRVAGIDKHLPGYSHTLASVDTAISNAEAMLTEVESMPSLLSALNGMLERYTALVNSGDAGNWDPEGDLEVIVARDAIAKATKA